MWNYDMFGLGVGKIVIPSLKFRDHVILIN